MYFWQCVSRLLDTRPHVEIPPVGTTPAFDRSALQATGIQRLPDHLHNPQRPTAIRLLNVQTRQLTLFEQDAPRYAILSHRWSANEARFEDWEREKDSAIEGYDKIRQFCNLIRNQTDIDWVWVDTCCIDKRLDAELSTAIRSMAAWYRASEFCVVHMNDVPPIDGSAPNWTSLFSKSEWFNRGWTLQELIFSPTIVFCSRDWRVIDKGRLPPMNGGRSMLNLISTTTGIPEDCLQDTKRIFDCSIAARLSWAARRVTTRAEDEAYCLMALLGVSMEVRYSEGRKAFFRLQKAILEACDDESIFAWNIAGTPKATAIEEPLYALLALEPKAFEGCGNISRADIQPEITYAITNAGLRLTTKALSFRNATYSKFDRIGEILLIELNCARVVGQDADGTEVRESCCIAIADLVQKGYGPGYVRIFPWYTGRVLYDYLCDPFPSECLPSIQECLEERVYHAAYASSCISASRLNEESKPQRLITLSFLREQTQGNRTGRSRQSNCARGSSAQDDMQWKVHKNAAWALKSRGKIRKTRSLEGLEEHALEQHSPIRTTPTHNAAAIS